jgi:hypothetical protein
MCGPEDTGHASGVAAAVTAVSLHHHGDVILTLDTLIVLSRRRAMRDLPLPTFPIAGLLASTARRVHDKQAMGARVPILRWFLSGLSMTRAITGRPRGMDLELDRHPRA